MEFGLVLLWFVAYAALAALAAPAASALFSRFPGKGAGFALPLSLATLAMTSYYVGRIAFGYESLFAGLAVIAVASGVALYRGVEVDRRGYVEAMAVFAVPFLLFVLVRGMDPGIYPGGGEKFLDFGLLNSLMRAETIPPEDMWYAGEPVAYYYGGHMIAALVAKLTGTAPRYAYNLAVPGFYGVLVTGAYTLASAVAAEHDADRVSAGILAGVLVGAASNLTTPMRFLGWIASSIFPGVKPAIESLGVQFSGLLQGPQYFGYWAASRVIEGTINEFPFFAFVNGDMHAHMMSTGFLLLVAGLLYSFWQAPSEDVWRRRAILFVCLPLLAGMLAITNTWSFPTVGGLTLLAVSLAPGRPWTIFPLVDRLVRLFSDDDAGDDPRGDTTTTHSDWTDPTAEAADRDDADAAETAVPDEAASTPDDAPAGDAATSDEREIQVEFPFDPWEEVVRVGTAVLAAGMVGVVGFVLVYPFFTTSASDRTIKLVENHSGLWELLLVHGGFLAVTVPYLVVHADPGGWKRRFEVAALFVVLAIPLAFFPLLPVGVALFAPFLLTAWLLLRADRDVSFETALVVGALGLVTLVEVFYVTRAGRYNTVFKFYMQVWVLWGTAAGVMLARHANPFAAVDAVTTAALERIQGRLGSGGGTATDGGARPSTGGSDPLAGLSRGNVVGGLLAVVLLGSVLLYPTLALAEHAETNPGPMTLDGTRFVEERHSTEAGAIEFVRGIEGQPNLVSISTQCMYRWSDDYRIREFTHEGPTPRTTPCSDYEVVGGSAAASLTGVPTVAGWHHEVGYRGRDPFMKRVHDVERIYNGTPSQRVDLLEKYDVEYVYVGPGERYRWGNVTFDGVTGLEVAYDSEWVTIYRVHQDELAVRGSASVARSERDGSDGAE